MLWAHSWVFRVKTVTGCHFCQVSRSEGEPTGQMEHPLGLSTISLHGPAGRGLTTRIFQGLRASLGERGQVSHPICRAATQTPAVGLAAICPPAPAVLAGSWPCQLAGFIAVKKDYLCEAMSVGDRWTSGALSFGAAESHKLKVWEIQELDFSQVTGG